VKEGRTSIADIGDPFFVDIGAVRCGCEAYLLIVKKDIG
jgi:hypothetical protein